MTKRYRQSQGLKIKEHFRDHPYYKLCKTVFDEFQQLCPTMVMTPEQLFIDAAQALDSILTSGDKSTERCRSLWTEKYHQYREQDGTSGDKTDTMAEVAMLFYMVMYGVATVNLSHYRGTLQRTLHDCIFKFYGFKECLTIERKLLVAVNQHTVEMMEWMEEYFTSSESMTKEMELLLNPGQKTGSRKITKKKDTVYYTLPYKCRDTKTRVNRVNIVMRKWQEWKWIEEPKSADDFDHLFDGEPRNCNLKWIGKLYILTELIKQLLNQHYMDNVTGLSARSIVKNQFGKNISGNKERIDSQSMERIKLIVYILDYNKPLPLQPKGKGEGDDISDLALQAVFSKELHITKDLNRQYQ